MRSCILSVCLFVVISLLAGQARAQVDWSEANDLLRAVSEGHRAVAEGAEEELPALIEDAIERDTQFLTWIDEAIATTDFGMLPVESQLDLLNRRNRAQLLRARLYLRQGECRLARDDIEAIGSRANVDPELRQALDAELGEILRCVPPTATVEEVPAPDPATGEATGTASDLVADAATDAEESTPSEPPEPTPVVAEVPPTPPEEPVPTPEVAEPVPTPEVAEPVPATLVAETAPADEGGNLAPWILMGSGAALIAGGIGYDVAMAGDRTELENLNNECREQLCDYTRAEELDESLSTARIVEWTLLGAGAAAVVTGVILLLVSDGSSDPSVTAGVQPVGDGFRAVVSGEF